MQNSPARKAHKEDAAICAEIYGTCFPDKWDMEKYIVTSECYLFEDKGLIIFELLGDEAEIKTIAVKPEARGQKIGEVLCTKALETCKNKSIFLEVSEKNIPAIKLYEKIGFESFSRRKNYYPDGAAAILMRKSA